MLVCMCLLSTYLLPSRIFLCLALTAQQRAEEGREHKVLSGDMKPASQSVFRGEGLTRQDP